MSSNFKEKAWRYHRKRWSEIKNPLYGRRLQRGPMVRSSNLRYVLRDYSLVWGYLGPIPPPDGYSGILVSVYSYTGADIRNISEYLLLLVSISHHDVVFVKDLPDLMEILALLAPLASNGVFTNVYKLGINK